MSELITPGRALELVSGNVGPLGAEECPLAGAAFRYAAEDIAASEAYPWFSFSAMDGFAVASGELATASPDSPVVLPVSDEIPAGDTRKLALAPGTVMKIMTGAPLPEGADAVVMKEVVTESGRKAKFAAPVPAWRDVNRAGEEIRVGRVLVAKGQRLAPPVVGLLAAMGIVKVRVHGRPRVAVIATGDELVPPGGERTHGRIYDSVSPMLSAALSGWGAAGVELRRCGDDETLLRDQVAQAMENAEIVLTVGGVSVGDYDFAVPAMVGAGFKQVFHGVRQKPGKPLFFGVTDNGKCAFGLPGNPASALVSTALYVRRALEIMAGSLDPAPRSLQAVAGAELINRTDRTQFIRVVARVRDDGITECEAAGGQGSYMLSSFAASDALAELPPGPMTLPAGEPVTVYPLNW